jgi:glycosyltransferase involved in cell wall biosynthesis
MRILFWSVSFWPDIGGVGVLAAKLLPALRGRGYEFVVVSWQSSPDLPAKELFKGIPVYRFPFWRSYNNVDEVMEIRQHVTQLKRTFAPNLVHINAVSPSDFFHWTTANSHPVPLLATLHGQWEDQLDSIIRSTLRNADWVVGSSAAILRRGQRLVPDITPRSSVIHNALEEPALLPEPLPFHPPRVLCLGRLVFYKGFDLALTAFASIVQRFPQARLVIAGDGPMRADLERQAAELGLTGAVAFVGWVAPDKVLALINSVTMVVLPSWGEGLPVVALEAAFMARPVVAMRVGGLPEIVIHQQTGLLIEGAVHPQTEILLNREDSTGLTQAISFLLEHPDMATQMGQAARQRVREDFSFERCVDAYDALYQQLAKEARREVSS